MTNTSLVCPSPMPPRTVSTYSSFKSAGALRKAMEKSKVGPIGHWEGRDTDMWRREDLDSFLLGKLPQVDVGLLPDLQGAAVGNPSASTGQRPLEP